MFQLCNRTICPDDKLLFFSGYRFRNDKYKYKRQFKEYKCYDCVGCPLRDDCINTKTSSIYKKRKIDVKTFFVI
ncbi:transposase [Staphylococcus aureus]